jgi:hypothetical protein
LPEKKEVSMEIALFHEGNRITVIHYRPELLSPEERRGALFLEQSELPPEPEVGPGQRAELWLQDGYEVQPEQDKSYISGKDLEWRLFARPLTQEELLAAVCDRLDLLLARQDQIIELLRRP